MTVEKQEVYLSNRRSFYRTELLKSAFIVMSLVWEKNLFYDIKQWQTIPTSFIVRGNIHEKDMYIFYT